MEDQIKISCRLEFKDYLNFNFWLGVRKFRWIALIPFIVGIAQVILLGSLGEAMDLSVIAPPFVVAIFFIILMATSVYFNSKNVFENDQFLRKEHHYTFSQDGIVLVSENSNVKISWGDIFKHEESRNNAVVIYLSPNKVLILPERFFSGNDHYALKTILKSNVKSKERKSFFTLARAVIWVIILALFGFVFAINYGSPNPAEEFFQNGTMKDARQDYEGAILEFDKAIEQDPSFARAYAYRGRVKGKLQDYAGEIEDCNKAIALQPDFGMAYYFSGSAKHFLGDSAGCCQDFLKADDLGFYEAKKAIEQCCQ